MIIKNDEHEWFPSLEEYTPGLSVDEWLNLLNDPEVFDENSLTVIKAFYDIGGQATCKELSIKYGKDPGFYSMISKKLAKRIHKKTNCPLINDDLKENAEWWTILYVGKEANKQQEGVYIWKLRDELKEALHIQASSAPKAWLLAWNPNNYDWESVDDKYNYYTMLKKVQNGDKYTEAWRCHAKYYGRSMIENYDKATLRSAHLYQIFAYVKNMDVENAGNVSGLLLYAKTEDEVFPNGQPFIIGGNSIGARTLDLNQDFKHISKQLDDIVNLYFQ